MSLIPAENDFLVWALMFLICALAFMLEKTTWGKKVSGPIIMVASAAILSNMNIMPKSAPAYGTVWVYGVPTAVVLLLFGANLKRVISESGPTFIAFMVGAVGTTLGVLLGVWLLSLGQAAPELAAVFSATYIGGSLNFAAVAEAIGFQNNNLLTASVAADNVVGVLFMTLLIALPSIKIVARFFGYDANALRENDTASDAVAARHAPSAFSPLRASMALGVALFIVAISQLIADWLGYEAVRLLVATVIVVLLASLFPARMAAMTEAFPIGMLVMYLFFFIIGAGVDIAAMFESGLRVAAFASIILVTHLVILLSVCRLLRVGLPEVMVGSNACVIGPPSAAAMAGAYGWKDLVTPAILCGTFGYAIANFIALTLYAGLS